MSHVRLAGVVGHGLAVRAGRGRFRVLRALPVGPAGTAPPAVPVALPGLAAMVVWPWVRAPRVLMAVAAMVVPVATPERAVMAELVLPATSPPLRVVRAATAAMLVRRAPAAMAAPRAPVAAAVQSAPLEPVALR